MATITHTFTPNQVVYELTDDCGVVEVTVLKVLATVDAVTTVVSYSVQEVKTNKVKTVLESKLYVLLSGVGSALEAYALTIV